MNEKELQKLLKKIQQGSDITSEIVESLILELLLSKGIVPEDNSLRIAYGRFFNDVRLAESKYNKARSNIHGIAEAVEVIRAALLQLDTDV